MKSNPYIKLAKQSIEYYLKTGSILKTPAGLPKEMLGKRAGVFVSIHKAPKSSADKEGELRGCIGTFLPTRKNIAGEIIHNAVSAATEDYRFPPITLNELPDLVFSVDVLSKPKAVAKDFPLNPRKYGLIVSGLDGRRGLLLPDIAGVNTPEEQISICKLKGGIGPEEKVSLAVFTVTRHH